MNAQPRSATAPSIVYHLNSIAFGGMELHALVLAKGVAAAGWRVSVILPTLPVLDPLAEEFAGAGIATHRISVTGDMAELQLARAWAEIQRLLHATKPDILHQHRTGPYHGKWTVLAARVAGVPIVVASEHQAAYRLHGLQRWSTAAADLLVDRFVAVSDHDYRCQVSESGRPTGKLVRIYNGIDASSFQPSTPEAVAADRAALGIPQGVPVIGTVARLEEQKGVTHLLHALPALKACWPELVVLIAGRGSLRAALEAEATQLGVTSYTHFLGFVPSPASVMSLMDVVVIPSVWEPFGMVAAEAMSVGKPVAVSRVGGLPEVVEDGVSGVVVPPGDPDALFRAVDRLLADRGLRQRLAEAGARRVAERFTVQVMAENMEALYRQLLGQRRRQRGDR